MTTLSTNYVSGLVPPIAFSLDGDPTTFAWAINARPLALLTRTDVIPNVLYYKSGPIETDWTLVGSGAALATVTARIIDGPVGQLCGAAVSIFASGQHGSISLLASVDNTADDANDVNLEIKVSGGTLRIRPVTAPDEESAALLIDNVATGSFIDDADAQLAADFTTTSTSFVPLLVATLTPVPGTDLRVWATVNFTWTI
jgi:hypothetical protein